MDAEASKIYYCLGFASLGLLASTPSFAHAGLPTCKKRNRLAATKRSSKKIFRQSPARLRSSWREGLISSFFFFLANIRANAIVQNVVAATHAFAAV